MKTLFNSSKFLIISIGAVIMCYIAFYNHYPLVYSDTGTYINSGFTNEIPVDRPIYYGLILRHISLSRSLWLVILFQSYLLSYLMYKTIEVFSSGKNIISTFLFSTFFLTLFSSISVITSLLIPDVFTSISFLCWLLLVFSKLEKRSLIIISTIYVISLLVHSSHIMIHSVLMIFTLINYLYIKIRKQESQLKLKRFRLCLALVFGTLAFLPTINYFIDGEFRLSKMSHVITMAHLIEVGILQDYLAENCNNNNYKICDYQNNLGFNFMYLKDSPLYLTGSWESNKEEYNTIIRDVFSNPEYIKIYIQTSIEYTFKQFFSFDIREQLPYTKGTEPYIQIDWRFKDSILTYSSTLQSNSKLDLTDLNQRQLITFFGSFFILLTGLLIKSSILEIKPLHKRIIKYLLLFLFLNAAICATLTVIQERYQYRIIWLLPFFGIILIEVYGLKVIRNWKNLLMNL